MNKSPITTHILNLESGLPAVGVNVSLFSLNDQLISEGITDEDGRIINWPEHFVITAGCYKLRFEVGDWYKKQGQKSFYPYVELVFEVDTIDKHYHVPLLLNAYGFSTYRGS